MSRQRIGDLLRRQVPLTAHDIEEILHEQLLSRRSFGDVALSLGLCTPEDVWKAWCEQLKDSIEHVNLDKLGIDSQATARLPRELAVAFGAVPVRYSDNHLVIAVTDESFDRAVAALPQTLDCRVKFVIAASEQVTRALSSYYRPQAVPA